MWTNLFHFSVSPLELVFRALAIYIFILLLLRMSGKREIGQTSPLEFVAILLISNAVQNAMNGGDNSLAGGLLLALVLIVVSWSVAFFTYRSIWVSRLVEGTPTLLIHKGRLLKQNLSRERISVPELHSLLRKQGVHHFGDVLSAVLEPDGVLTITKVGEEDLHPHMIEGKEDFR